MDTTDHSATFDWLLGEDSDWLWLEQEFEERSNQAPAGIAVADGSVPVRRTGGAGTILIGPGPFHNVQGEAAIWIREPSVKLLLAAAEVLHAPAYRGLVFGTEDLDFDGASIAVTAREAQVLDLLARGLPNKGIAAELGISLGTAKFHIANLMQKLGAQSRAELVIEAAREGLIQV